MEATDAFAAAYKIGYGNNMNFVPRIPVAPRDRPRTAAAYRQTLELAGQAGITGLDKSEFSDLLQVVDVSHAREREV